MTTAAKITYFGALLIGLSIGAALGFHNTTLTIQSYLRLRQITAPAVLRDFSYLQYRYADPQHAEAALLILVNFLEDIEKSAPDSSQGQSLATAYIRLALVADATHDPERSSAYMEKARCWYRAKGGQDHSDSEMKAALKAADAKMERFRP
ncbi:MAG TPA: hypothetical protein VKT50_10855 [Candidatus Acidoferrales bacterium]|nr:hypothetical protein [Candidatus Acidoferrales bacterium]